MTGKKLGKFLLVWLCIITLIMPFGAEVLAAALTSESTTAVLESVPYREGGAESTGITSDKYDRNSYAYKIGGVNVLKVIQKDDNTFADAFYCINAELSLSVTQSYNYKKAADDFTVLSDSEVRAWADSVGISEENYNSLLYLLKHLYLKKQDTSYKNTYIANAFANLIAEETVANGYAKDTTVDSIKEVLTDDDIDVIQQWAIWYFTNGTNNSNEYYNNLYTALGTIEVTHPVIENGAPVTRTEDLSQLRQDYAKILYDYLISSAKNPLNDTTNKGNLTYPMIDKTNTVTSVVEGQYYKVGPFKVNSGNTTPSDLNVSFVTEGGVLSDVNYKIYEDNVDVTQGFSSLALDKEYYVYLPIENNKITSVKLTISYTKEAQQENISLWTGVSDTWHLQPLVLLTKKPGEKVEDEIVGKIVEKQYDLALRKFVVSINGNATQGRVPTPTTESLQKLASGTVTTAEYNHSKNPLSVKKGDKVVYEFRIYNEGDLDAKVQNIVDYLPEGLTVVDKSLSTVNSKYNWNVDGTTITNDYLANTTIPAFNKETMELSYVTVQVECEITGDLKEGTKLTNVAEIKLDDGTDRDSTEGSIDKLTITDEFSGNPSNKDDLSDSNYYYKGLQDDDDFEKLVIEGKQFDLSLKKFISKVNSKDYSKDRAPTVDVSPLNNGKDDAAYTTAKTPIDVETGDIVTFTLRVYNEGDISGYAEEITDYIPEGLGFLVNYNTNYNNRWAISSDSKSVKLSTIKNGTKNVTKDDFIDVNSLDDVEVVLGKTKIKSTALASSQTSNSNLIKAFDKTKLDYKDIQISCIVIAEDAVTLKNIAAVTKESDENKEPVETDRGSKDRDSTPDDDIDPDKYTTGNEDDDDYDVIKTDKKNFDLALQKFITAVNNNQITDRVPLVSTDSEGNIKYAHTTEPLRVGNGDLITYTIRVYNEGQIDGYAKEIMDDIPNGLIFVPDNEINKKYEWKLYDKSGKETTDLGQASSVKTNYLSKEKSDNNLLKAYDGKTISYKDVQIVFKIEEKNIEKTVTTEARTLINTAEITDDSDKDGNDIEDKDSTPGNGDPSEDDIDKEKVYVKYFDLSLKKDVTKALVTVDGQTTEVNVSSEGEAIKVEVHRKKLDATSIKFVYNITVKNEGEIEGYATEITDYIPAGLEFAKEDNPEWDKVSENVISTNALAKTLLQPGQTAQVPVILRWTRKENNTGKFVNIAEISDDWNSYDSEDVDSTPNNLIPTEDDYDTAPVWVGIVTGMADQPYIVLTSIVLFILGTGIVLIKKYVL